MTGIDISYFQDEHNEDVKHTHLILSLRFDKYIDKNTALKYAMNDIKALLDIKEALLGIKETVSDIKQLKKNRGDD